MHGLKEAGKFVCSNECDIFCATTLNDDDFSIIRHFVEERCELGSRLCITRLDTHSSPLICTDVLYNYFDGVSRLHDSRSACMPTLPQKYMPQPATRYGAQASCCLETRLLEGVGMADLLELALLILEPFIPRDLLARLPFWAEVALCIAILGGMGLWIWMMYG